jgi:hypothetical protein
VKIRKNVKSINATKKFGKSAGQQFLTQRFFIVDLNSMPFLTINVPLILKVRDIMVF